VDALAPVKAGAHHATSGVESRSLAELGIACDTYGWVGSPPRPYGMPTNQDLWCRGPINSTNHWYWVEISHYYGYNHLGQFEPGQWMVRANAARYSDNFDYGRVYTAWMPDYMAPHIMTPGGSGSAAGFPISWVAYDEWNTTFRNDRNVCSTGGVKDPWCYPYLGQFGPEWRRRENLAAGCQNVSARLYMRQAEMIWSSTNTDEGYWGGWSNAQVDSNTGRPYDANPDPYEGSQPWSWCTFGYFDFNNVICNQSNCAWDLATVGKQYFGFAWNARPGGPHPDWWWEQVNDIVVMF